MYHAITPMMKSLHTHTHTQKGNKIKWLFPCICMRVSGWMERIHQQQHFLMVVPQPISFCLLKKQASHRAWFIIPCLTHHFFWQDTAWQNAASVLQLVHCSRAAVEGWGKQGLQPTVERFKNSYNGLSERTVGQIYMYCEIRTPQYSDLMHAAFKSLLFMLACTTW